MAQVGWIIDTKRCIGCRSCHVACKSENKTSIRSFILVGLSLVSVVGAFWVAFVTMASFAILPS